MEFEDSEVEAAFRAEAAEWLESNARRKKNSTDLARAYRPKTEAEDEAVVAAARAWQAQKADAGWACIHWPSRYGGRDLPAALASIFSEEENGFDVPGRFFQVGTDMVGPTLIEFGTQAQRDRYLPPLLRGEEIWCQLFSEPGAGSDLAGLSTRAIAVDGGFSVTGQKVWTTGAHYADFAILLARTDPEAPKHRGISYFVLDMRTTGIEVRPLRQSDGGIHFNEVFLDDVFVPNENLVAELHDGWRVARATLTFERTAIGGGGMVTIEQVREVRRLVAETVGASALIPYDDEFGELFIQSELLRFLGYRVRSDIAAGRRPGPESSVIKLAVSRFTDRATSFCLAQLGAAGMLADEDAPGSGMFTGLFLSQWAPRIGGGTDEIQRNVIAERVLGLPR